MRYFFRKKKKSIIAFILSVLLIFTAADLASISSFAYSTEKIVGFEALSEDIADITIYRRIPETELKSVFPAKLSAYMSDGSTKQISVTWKSAGDYSEEDEYYYVYDPVISGFDLAEGVEAPYIVVWVRDYVENMGIVAKPSPADISGEGTVTDGTMNGTDGNGSDGNGSDAGSNLNETEGSVSGSTDGNTDVTDIKDTDSNSNNGGSGSDKTDTDGTSTDGTGTDGANNGGSKDTDGSKSGDSKTDTAESKDADSSETDTAKNKDADSSETDTAKNKDVDSSKDSTENKDNSESKDSSDNKDTTDNKDIDSTDNKDAESTDNKDADSTDASDEEASEETKKSNKSASIIPTRSNEENTFHYLVEEMGLSEAAAVGVMANISAESGFRNDALGDKINGEYTSFGICQWHNSRWTSLKIFCATMDEDWESLEGQLKYLRYELEHNYKYVLNALLAVSNTPEGAYEAGYAFCVKFEVPANKEEKGAARGKVARDKFWPKYGGYVTDNGQTYIWRTGADGKSYWYENGVKQGTVEDAQGVLGDGTVRGREIYDPLSDAWYWLDAVYDGAKAVNKEVWIPYVYNGEDKWEDAVIVAKASNSSGMAAQIERTMRANGTVNAGKWVRYDSQGRMIKGWYTVEGDDIALYPDQAGKMYYYDPITGLMAKGRTTINGVAFYFDEVTGALIS